MNQFKFKWANFWLMKAASISQRPFRQGLFQLCPCKISFNSVSLDNEISNNKNNSISCGSSLQARNFWFTLMVFTCKKILAERSGEEKSLPVNPFSPSLHYLSPGGCWHWWERGSAEGFYTPHPSGSSAHRGCWTNPEYLPLIWIIERCSDS